MLKEERVRELIQDSIKGGGKPPLASDLKEALEALYPGEIFTLTGIDTVLMQWKRATGW